MAQVHLHVIHMDEQERYFSVSQEVPWRVKEVNGVPMLIIGTIPPRTEIPLCNVRYYEVQPCVDQEGEVMAGPFRRFDEEAA